MAQSIQRLRYFDGEYLRSNDFTDEQSYHVAMRRRLNLALHLSGIAYGLEIQRDANSVPPLYFFSISQGFAIDQLGREIVVSAPYELSSDNVLSRAGLQAGLNEVWIVYTETATGLPAPGYQLCDQPGQNTRWTESFDIRLKPSGAPPSTTGDDPKTDLKGVLLGHVTVTNDQVNGWMITDAPPPDALGRTYVGIRAQSIVAPDLIDTDTFQIQNQNVAQPTAGATAAAPSGYLDVGPGVFVRGNMFVEKNMVLGDDFLLDHTANPNLPAPGKFPPNGNLKLNGDLFLNGAFYGLLGGAWLGLGDYIKSLMPDVQTGFLDLDVSGAGGATTGPQPPATVPLTTALTSYKKPPLFSVGIAGFTLLTNNQLTGLITATPNVPVQVLATAVAVPTGQQTLNLDLTWTVGPNNLNTLPLQKIRISWIVIFTPGP
jgi:hypothetical protein